MSDPITLRGMTWKHARGRAPVDAAARRFHELNPGVRVEWHDRSLQAFEDFPIGRLAEEFDLIVLDHPWVGEVARAGALLPLDEHLPEDFLADQAANAVGASHRSYEAAGHRWALAIDAAAPVAFWREDLMSANGARVPASWAELLELAARGHVEVPAVPINCMMNFFSLALAAGGHPGAVAGGFVEAEAGLAALAALRELLERCPAGSWERDPIASHELVASAGNRDLWYCPLAYGYSNYARDGFRDHRLAFGQPPVPPGGPLATVLGGAGLGVSARRPQRAAALAFARFVASAEIQRTLYTHSGGQPGHRGAWTDPENNRITHGYFQATLPVLDRAWLRPRHDGFIRFQHEGALLVQAALRRRMADREALAGLDELHLRTVPAGLIP